MKSIHITFEDDEFKWMKKLKGDMSWRDFIVSRCSEPRNQRCQEYDPKKGCKLHHDVCQIGQGKQAWICPDFKDVKEKQEERR